MKRKGIKSLPILFLLYFSFAIPLLAAPQTGGHSVTLSWVPGAQPEGETVTSWNIYRSLANTSSYALISNVSVDTLAYTDDAVVAGTTYSYVLTALDTSGVESAYSSSVNAAIPGDVSLLSITTSSLPQATVGGSYSATLAAAGGVAPYIWSGSGVPGLTLSAAGLLAGTPTQSGVFTETFTVTDSAGTSSSISVPVSVIAAAPVPAQGFPDGLALYWTFDTADIVNGIVADASNNGNTGILVGNAQSVQGELNQALNFNGSTAYVLSGSDVGGLTQSLTLAAWINTANTTRTETIMSRFDASSSGAGYIFTTDQNGNLDLRIGGADLGAYPNYITDPTTINDGKWHHVAVTISFESQMVKFYVDGNLTSTTPVNVMANGNGGSGFQVGVNPWTGYGDYFTGTIDNVQIYNRALGDSELKSVYVLTSNLP